MGSDFDTKSAVDEIQKTAKADEKFQGTVSTQNLEKKDPIKVVIIGGGACGMAVATKIRRQSDFEITVISRDSHTAYSHCGIPFVLGREIESFEKLIVKPRDFFQKKSNRCQAKRICQLNRPGFKSCSDRRRDLSF
nr:FAD/NAD(P)-binding oxidoreductase [Methanosarcina barkeri]